MKKIYMSLLAAGMLLSTGYGVANAAVQTSAPAKEAESGDETQQVPYGPDINLGFKINGDKCYVEGTIKAPTELMGNWETGTSDKPIEGTMTIRLEKLIQNSEDKPIVVEEWENIEPGQEVTFTDTDVTIGETWVYHSYAICDGVKSEEWYGTQGAYIGLRPNEVTDFVATSNKGAAPITVTLTVPDGFSGSDIYTDIKYVPTRVYVTRGYVPKGEYDQLDVHQVWEQANPTVGTPITFEDSNEGIALEEGTYHYEAFVEWAWGESFSQTTSVGIYQDAPSSPQNVMAAPVNGGMLITWDAVTEPLGNGYLDPESVVYDVYRYYGYQDTRLIGENIKETEFLDDLAGIDKQIVLQYQIFAKNDNGSSTQWDGLSEAVIAGPACPLPFVEAFGTKGQYSITSDMLWVNRSLEGSISWVVDNYATYYLPDWTGIDIKPTDESKGVAYVTFYSWQPTGECTYTSGDIDFQGHDEGMVTVRYYGHPDGLANLNIDLLRHDVEADEYISETIWSHSIKADKEGWIEASASFIGYTGCDKLCLILRAIGTETSESGIYIPVAVEYVSLQATDQGSSVELNDADVVSTQYFTLQGVGISNPEKGMPVIRRATLSNGKVITSKVVIK